MSGCSNTAVWGHYGNNHKGVCLKFKTKEVDKKLVLILENESKEFRKIEYHNKHTKIDFFRSIGELTKNELNKLWYRDSKGNFCECGIKVNQNENLQAENYWRRQYNSTSIKLKEWEYESEYRLIIVDSFYSYVDKTNR